MELSPLAAVAIEVPLLVACAAVLLQGDTTVRWLRMVLLGLGWLLVHALLQPIVPTDEGPLAGVPVVPALAIAALLVAFFAAAREARTGRQATRGALAALAGITAFFLAVPEPVGLGLALALWVGGTGSLAWVLWQGARAHPGSVLQARLRLLAVAQLSLAIASAATFGGPFTIAWLLPMVTGTSIIALAVAMPPFIRIVPASTRAALREAERHVVTAGSEDPRALDVALQGIADLLGAAAAVLVDRGRPLARVGDPELVAAVGELVGELGPTPSTFLPAPRGHWVLAGDTGRGALLLVLPPVGVLLSRTDRELVDALAERLGLVLTQEDAHRADARADAATRAADRMRDDMLSTLSHELRTPLTSVLGFAELLREHRTQMDEAEVELLLDRIADRSRHLEVLVGGLLELTAVRGRGTGERLSVQGAAELVERAAHRAGQPGRIEMRPTDVVLHTDGHAVVGVLEELLTNALKFSPTGSPVVVEATANGEHAVIAVTDLGPGLGDVDGTAFDPFVRGGDVLTRDTGGLGIGLTIARERAHQLGGELTARSTPEGCTFELTIPQRHALAERRPRRSAPATTANDPTLLASGRP